MDYDYVSITPGDGFAIDADQDGNPGIRIQNDAFVEAPRWLLFQYPGDDQNARITALIDTLTTLRDATPPVP